MGDGGVGGEPREPSSHVGGEERVLVGVGEGGGQPASPFPTGGLCLLEGGGSCLQPPGGNEGPSPEAHSVEGGMDTS